MEASSILYTLTNTSHGSGCHGPERKTTFLYEQGVNSTYPCVRRSVTSSFVLQSPPPILQPRFAPTFRRSDSPERDESACLLRWSLRLVPSAFPSPGLCAWRPPSRRSTYGVQDGLRNELFVSCYVLLLAFNGFHSACRRTSHSTGRFQNKSLVFPGSQVHLDGSCHIHGCLPASLRPHSQDNEAQVTVGQRFSHIFLQP